MTTKKQLKPIVCGLVAGLIGVANATCYWESSYVCEPYNTDVMSVCYSDCCATAKTTSDWYGWTLYQSDTYVPGTNTGTKSVYCSGQATYLDCHSGQRMYINGSVGSPFTKVDYSSPLCSP